MCCHVLDGVLEVRAGGRGGALGITREACGEDRVVLGVEPRDREVGLGTYALDASRSAAIISTSCGRAERS